MKYFCDAHVQSRKNQERRIFIILEQTESEMQPHLTKDILLQNIQYRDFVETYRPKLVMVDYAAVPTEDLQIKGAVVKGQAEITLPEFDRTDFFTHVPGYTWGFSTDPDAEKIEYYGGQTYSFKEDTKLYQVLVKYGGGSGTKDDPYLINYYDQLELMSEEKARGYFRQTEDISFPDWENHTPIDTVNELKAEPDAKHFEYDGGGFRISNLQAPLFGNVSGALIENVNITASRIDTEEYADCGFIACHAYNYRYKTEDGTQYETGETIIGNTAQLQKRKKYGIIEIWTDK